MVRINKKKALRLLGTALQEVRNAKNISVPELSQITGIAQNKLEQVEQGNVDIEYTTLLTIAKGLNSEVSKLLPVL